MKKYLIGLLSILLLVASIFGAQTKGAKDRRSGEEPSHGSDKALWV